MLLSRLRLLPVLAVFLLGACGERVELEVLARLDGAPAAQAKVALGGKELGVTDAQGRFMKEIRSKAGAELEVMVTKEAPGYRIEPWKTSFLVKLAKEKPGEITVAHAGTGSSNHLAALLPALE
jgi:hypothetical protein